MLVRTVGERDAETVARLLTALGYPQGPAAVAPRLLAWDTDPASHVLVAEVDGQVAGVLALHICPSFERPGSWGRIAALVVDPGSQGAGVGRLLVRAAHELAAAAGCTDMEVTSSRRRSGAHAFYRRLGYTDICGTSGRFMRSLTRPTAFLDPPYRPAREARLDEASASCALPAKHVDAAMMEDVLAARGPEHGAVRGYPSNDISRPRREPCGRRASGWW